MEKREEVKGLRMVVKLCTASSIGTYQTSLQYPHVNIVPLLYTTIYKRQQKKDRPLWSGLFL
ncbi:hypothetical protein BK130_21515 [Viridibacillus sp. FSL H8-0123]|nr:hypothetical protein BK130_21515 [Viridibacillus sp. FSL H8-0123]